MGLRQATTRPSRAEYAGLALFGLIVVLFGGLVVYRSAGLPIRHTDFAAYARAGWAVRSGQNIYDVTDERGLHYCYPPPFAILMSPFAEPPSSDGHRYLPFAISIAIWYVISIACVFAGSHILVSAIDRQSERGSRRWWALRLWPVLICLPAIGNTLSHSQTNTLLLLLVCGMIAAAAGRRSLRTGLWLATATALKVIPAFLLLVPALRRDRKWIAGFAIGMVAWLVVLPALAFGPLRAWEVNRQFIDVMVRPAVAGANGADRAVEMFHVLKTDNQSLQAVMHAWMHWSNNSPPAEPEPITRILHWTIGGLLTAMTVFAAFRAGRLSDDGFRRSRFRLRSEDITLVASLLIVVMLFISPMCHLHYYVLTLPLVAVLLNEWWRDADQLWPGTTRASLLAIHVVGGAIPLLFESIRNLGFAPLATLPLWFAGVRMMWNTAAANAATLQFTPAAPLRKAV